MTCYRVKLDDSSGIVLFALSTEDALEKAMDRRLNPNSSVLTVEDL